MHIGGIAPCIDADLGMYKFLENMPQPCKYCHPDGTVILSLHTAIPCFINPAASQDEEKQDKTSEFYEYGTHIITPSAIMKWDLWSEAVLFEYMCMVYKEPVSPQ